MGPKRNTPRHIIIKLPNIKDKERILKEARGTERVTYREKERELFFSLFPLRNQLISQKKPYREEGVGKKYSKS